MLAIMFLVSACANDTPPATTDDDTDTPAVTTGDGDDTEEPTGEVESPAELDVVTLQVLSLASNYSGLQEGWWADIVREELGIQFDILPAGEQGEQVLQVHMASGELPDILVFREAISALDSARAGLLIAFDDYLDHIPNVVANMGVAMQYSADVISHDGRTYVLPSSVGITPTIGDFGWGPMIRWDLYEQLGHPEIETLFDYIPLLAAMMELEPTNEHGQPTFGLSLWSDWDSVYMNLAGAFGSMQGISEGLPGMPLCEVDYNTNVVRSMLAPDSAYMQGLRFFFEANQAGIIDPDSITQRFDNSFEKTSAGRVFYQHWPWASSGFDSPERLNAEVPQGFMAIPFNQGYAPVTYEFNPVGRAWTLGLSSSGDHIERALSWVNWIADVDNSFLIANGPQGLLWDVDDTGTPFTTEHGYELRLDPEAHLPGGGRLRDGFEVINFWPLGLGNISETFGVGADHRTWPGHQPEMTRLGERYYEHTGFTDNVSRITATGSTTPQPLATMFLPPPPDDIIMIATRIGDVVQPTSWLMIFAEDEAEFERLLSEMRETADALGMAELLEYAQQAWADALQVAAQYEVG